MVKYLILGNGFLGNKFQEYFNSLGERGEESAIGHVRINSIKDIYLELATYKPEVIINCIGKTGRPNVDWCESHREETFFSNVTIPIYIAEVCEKYGGYMVHIGSGCIFEGDNEGDGYGEYDSRNFRGSFYSKTKIFAEQILLDYVNTVDILKIRIRMPIDNKPSDRNLIDKLIKYKRVIGNVPNSVTCVPDLMNITKKLMDRRVLGPVHIVNEGVITHNEILEMYKKIVDPNFEMPEFIDIDKLKELTKTGRSNCMLVSERLPELGIKMREVHEAISCCLTEYGRYI